MRTNLSLKSHLPHLYIINQIFQINFGDAKPQPTHSIPKKLKTCLCKNLGIVYHHETDGNTPDLRQPRNGEAAWDKSTHGTLLPVKREGELPPAEIFLKIISELKY